MIIFETSEVVFTTIIEKNKSIFVRFLFIFKLISKEHYMNLKFYFDTITRLQSYLALICVIIFVEFSATAQNITEVDAISLNGTWDIIFDDNNEGVHKKWILNENFNKHSNIQKITVPSCWEEIEENYEGVGIYRTEFDIPNTWKDRIIDLNFEASNYKTEIWINDQVVGFHEGGYTPFSFRVDKLIKLGAQNTLIVRVVSPIILTDKYIDGMGRQEVPMWRGAITGGIWQSVSISSKGKIGLKDVFIQPQIERNTASFAIELENTQIDYTDAELQIEVLSKNNEQVVSKKEKVQLAPGKKTMKWDLELKNAKLWSVDNPYLYTAKISLIKNGIISDSWSHRFGMREFSVINNQFTLNGKPLYLKGAFFEGLYPTKLAYPDTKEMAIKEITLAKEAGFNMIRPWRKPAPKMWLDLCDEMGVLTVGSLVVECMHRPISTPRLPFVVENELTKTILKNRNRTCIVQWELFNEINRPILAQMLNSMSVLARELDPTRMILDESGGWGEGANIYLPNEKKPTKFNDIHHYSGSQVNEKEFNGYLATARNNESLKKQGLQGNKGYGRNVVPEIMTYISELGYGSTPNLTSNNKDFAGKGNPIVAPTVYHKELDENTQKALQKVGFDKIYPKVEDFYLEQQKMHGIANKRMLEAARLNPVIAGYCVHALVGGDWVLGAGLLDLWRNPKTLVYDMTKEANQPQTTPIRILPRNVYAEKGTKIEVYGVSELPDEKVHVSIKIVTNRGKQIYKKQLSKNFSTGISELFDTELNTTKLKGTYKVLVTVKNNAGKTISNNYQTFDVFTVKQLKTPKATIAVIDPEGSLKKHLKNKQFNIVEFDKNLDTNIPVFIGKAKKKNKEFKSLVTDVKAYVKNGGYAVFLQVLGESIPGFDRELVEVSADKLPFGAQMQGKWATLGGWAPKSHIITKHPVFKDLPTKQIMHGAYENVHPITSMSKQEGTYIAGMIGYDHFPNNDIMVRHYNGTGDVWWAADVLETELGKGTMLLSTLQIIENLGKDPVADKLLWNMIEYASK